MGDLLSSASLLLAIIGMLFSLWYSDISDTLALKIPDYKDDRKPIRKTVKSCMISRCLPLVLSSVLVSLVFLPVAVGICVESADLWFGLRLRTFGYYDPVRTAIVIVTLFCVAFAVYSITLLWKMNQKLRACDG